MIYGSDNQINNLSSLTIVGAIFASAIDMSLEKISTKGGARLLCIISDLLQKAAF
jgi:hypothetical protein